MELHTSCLLFHLRFGQTCSLQEENNWKPKSSREWRWDGNRSEDKDSHKNQNPLALHGSDSRDKNTVSTTTTKSDKFLYFLFSISYTMCFMVVVIYWLMLFEPSEYDDKISSNSSWLLIDMASFSFCYLSNTFLTRFRSVFYSHLCCHFRSFVFVHTYFYYLATNKLVYSIFDWKNAPGKAVGYAFGLSLVCLILQFILFLLDLLSIKLMMELELGNGEPKDTDRVKKEEKSVVEVPWNIDKIKYRKNYHISLLMSGSLE